MSLWKRKYPHPRQGIWQEVLPGPPRRYRLLMAIVYYSPRYNKTATVHAGYESDGATGAFDIVSRGWWVHDRLCDNPYWDDGARCPRWHGSMVLKDILMEEGRWIRAWPWAIATWLHEPWG